MARAQGIAGWHSMRKEELIRALANLARRKGKSGTSLSIEPSSSKLPHYEGAGTRRRSDLAGGTAKTPTERLANAAEKRDLAFRGTGSSEAQDRLIVMVRDPYWLHAYWELAPRSVERARSALGQHWHSTRPILRVFQMPSDGCAVLHREITIHGGVNHWYIDVPNPPQQFRLEIGYLTRAGKFFCLARSNMVTTPPAGCSDAIDPNWVDIDQNADRIFAMSGGYTQRGVSQELQELLEERLQRPLGGPMRTRFGSGAARLQVDNQQFPFALDAELVVYGVSHPRAHVTIQGEPITLRPDGCFSVRMRMPERRQVIPVVASSSDGIEQRTIILAVERNTKVLDPLVRDPGA